MNGAAELKQTSWLEVTGKVRFTTKDVGYRISFKVSLTANSFGWSEAPVFLMVKFGRKGQTIWKRIKSLARHHKNKLPSSPTDPFDIPDPIIDHGPFEISKDQISSIRYDELYFGLYEVWSGKWKGGLQIHEVRFQQL